MEGPTEVHSKAKKIQTNKIKKENLKKLTTCATLRRNILKKESHSIEILMKHLSQKRKKCRAGKTFVERIALKQRKSIFYIKQYLSIAEEILDHQPNNYLSWN